LKKGCLIALGIPVTLVLWVIGLFWFEFYDIHVRYRLTVEVQDGDQIKAGSSVVEAIYNIEPSWSWSGPSAYPRMVGYPPSVDLGEKGLLFLTFSNAARTPAQIIKRNSYVGCGGNDMYCLPFEAYNKRGTFIVTDYDTRKVPLRELLQQSGPRDVPFEVLPELARYRVIEDWHTYKPISPYDLGASFGPGVELKRVILELTDDPVTPVPNMWPDWLKKNGRP